MKEVTKGGGLSLEPKVLSAAIIIPTTILSLKASDFYTESMRHTMSY